MHGRVRCVVCPCLAERRLRVVVLVAWQVGRSHRFLRTKINSLPSLTQMACMEIPPVWVQERASARFLYLSGLRCSSSVLLCFEDESTWRCGKVALGERYEKPCFRCRFPLGDSQGALRYLPLIATENELTHKDRFCVSNGRRVDAAALRFPGFPWVLSSLTHHGDRDREPSQLPLIRRLPIRPVREVKWTSASSSSEELHVSSGHSAFRKHSLSSTLRIECLFPQPPPLRSFLSNLMR